MSLIYSTKKLFGGYKLASSDLFGVNTKFKGDYFDFLPEEKGVRVVAKDGSMSHVFEHIRHLTGLNFFVCDNEQYLQEIYDKRGYVADEIYHTKTVCDSLTGKVIQARRIHQDYIVDEYGSIHFIENGTISREPFAEKAQMYDDRDYTSFDGSYLFTRDRDQNISVVSSKGEYVLKNIAKGQDTVVYMYGKDFPGNEITCSIQNKQKLAIVSEKGVIYETNYEPYKTLETGVVGDKYYINEYPSGESETTKMMIFDSSNKKLHEFDVSKSLWEVKEVDGEMVFVFAEGSIRNQKITEVKLADFIRAEQEKGGLKKPTAQKIEKEPVLNETKNEINSQPQQKGE